MSEHMSKIKKGYKQTEIGVIPEDWGMEQLGDVFKIRAGGDLDLKNYSEIKTYKFQYPIYSNSLISHGLYGFSPFFDYEGENVTVTARGTIGQANSRRIPFKAMGRLLILIPNIKIDTYFVSEYINNRIEFPIESTGVPQLTAPQISKFYIPLPSKPEQKAIATVLSDTDALIEKLAQLIIKKKSIKQATMQQLLTGKKRLAGFSGEWEKKKLGEISSISTGKKDVNEGNNLGIYPFFTCSKKLSYSDSYSFEGEAIMIAGNGEVGHLQYYNGKFEAYQRTYVLQNFIVNIDYLWLQLSANFEKSLGIGTIGSTIPYIKKENIYDFEYLCPVDQKEQKAIATILSDMDTEIEALEQERAKYQAIKQGMMQSLLTGAIRLQC
jgi:type I restriction enzyme S subunit